MPTVTKGSRVTENIHRLYELIDAGEISAMLELFTDDAVYQRPGYEPIIGRDQLERFYRQERVVSGGTHNLDVVLASGNNVAVRGRFRGVLKSGAKAEHQYAEFFTVSPEGRLAFRSTFFFAPLV